VRPFPNVKDGREKASLAGGRYPVWSAKGDELFYLEADGDMMVAPVTTSGAFANCGWSSMRSTSSREGRPALRNDRREA
jgi:hypothetical protein